MISFLTCPAPKTINTLVHCIFRATTPQGTYQAKVYEGVLGSVPVVPPLVRHRWKGGYVRDHSLHRLSARFT